MQNAALGKSVADGKTLLASTISEYGHPSAGTESFSSLANDIKIIANIRYNLGHSTGYQSGKDAGYTQGVTDADGRPNVNSVNYATGTTNGLSQAAYGLYTNQGYAGCWIAVYYENLGDKSKHSLELDDPYTGGVNNVVFSLQVPIHAPGNVPAFGAGGNWATVIYAKQVNWNKKTTDNSLDGKVIEFTGYYSRLIKVIIGHGDINAVVTNASTNLKVLRVF